MNWLKQQDDEGVIALRYFDEAGFSLTPVVPYGWQKRGETYRIPCQKSKRLNVLGFMGRENELFFHTCDKPVNTETVIEAFDAFAQEYSEQEFQKFGKFCFVILDNASMHRSHAFMEKLDDWLLQGVIPRHIPPYCPELNLIEILWRKVKYEWLPMSAYSGFSKLRQSVENTLNGFGERFSITFG